MSLPTQKPPVTRRWSVLLVYNCSTPSPVRTVTPTPLTSGLAVWLILDNEIWEVTCPLQSSRFMNYCGLLSLAAARTALSQRKVTCSAWILGWRGRGAEPQSTHEGQITMWVVVTCLKGGLQSFLKVSWDFSLIVLIIIVWCRSLGYSCYCSKSWLLQAPTALSLKSKVITTAWRLHTTWPYTVSPTSFSTTLTLTCLLQLY